jgi:hypothetical protein
MDPAEALSAGAEIAATLAGFTGVVVVFGRGDIHQWPLVDRFRLRLMLLFSVLPLVLALFGLLLLAIGPPIGSIWRICSGAAALVLVAGGLYALRGFLTFRPKQFTAEGGAVAIFVIVVSTGAASLALQVWNAATWGIFWPFFLAIVLSMSSAVLQFVRLILSRPPGPPAA